MLQSPKTGLKPDLLYRSRKLICTDKEFFPQEGFRTIFDAQQLGIIVRLSFVQNIIQNIL